MAKDFNGRNGDEVRAAALDVVTGDAPKETGLAIRAMGAGDVVIKAGPGEMIGTNEDAGIFSPGFLRSECGADEIAAFGRLGPGKGYAGAFHRRPEDARLVIRDIRTHWPLRQM